MDSVPSVVAGEGGAGSPPLPELGQVTCWLPEPPRCPSSEHSANQSLTGRAADGVQRGPK